MKSQCIKKIIILKNVNVNLHVIYGLPQSADTCDPIFKSKRGAMLQIDKKNLNGSLGNQKRLFCTNEIYIVKM